MQDSSGHLKTDVLIVGAGPAGLACAIHLARAENRPRRILVLEKSAHPGGHLLSGAVLRPDSLRSLLPPEAFAALPLGPAVTREAFHALTPSRSFRLPFVPPKMRMTGLPLVSAAALGRALADIAENLGVELLAGETADALLWDGDRVAGVRCENESVQASVTVLAEGPAGLLTRELRGRHPSMNGPNLQTHAIGLKECIEIPPAPAAAGQVLHTFGFPLGLSVYGGGFLYHIDDTHVALGLALALDYADPLLNPHDLFRRWKRHPLVQRHIANGRALEYGARLVPEGGWHSRIRLDAPGAFVIGDSAGLVDTMELKGLHLAVESGRAAANAILRNGPIREDDMPSLEGLRRTANYRAAFRGGLPAGMAAAGVAWITGGRLPGGRIPQRDERAGLRPAAGRFPPPPAADNGPLDLGLDSDLFLAHLRIREGACHIDIPDPAVCRDCFERFAAPCIRFCPAGVYAADESGSGIRIRAENCVQCRSCTLKCPFDNIRWQTPRHGVGPDYRRL
ncbi:MAG: NAD(P)-binding protein [Lentisphaerae bacterium]|nr:NAD(P)-binding protein [Lentisphaerota bacterium]